MCSIFLIVQTLYVAYHCIPSEPTKCLKFFPTIWQGNARILNSDTGDSLVQTTHISNQQYLISLMMFTLAYMLFEVPSNYMLKKFRPSRWSVGVFQVIHFRMFIIIKDFISPAAVGLDYHGSRCHQGLLRNHSGSVFPGNGGGWAISWPTLLHNFLVQTR